MTANSTRSKKQPAFIAQRKNDIAMRILQVWLVLGVAALVLCPPLRGSSEWFGWLPFWLVVAPLADGLILRWRTLFAASRDALRRIQRRRIDTEQKHMRRLQRVPSRRRKTTRADALLAAALFNR